MTAISITKPTVGGSTGTWGTELNTALDTIVTGVNTLDTSLSGKLTATTVQAPGDLLVATASSTLTRLPVGASNQVLSVDSAGTGGLAWKLAPGSMIARLRSTGAQSIPTGAFTTLLYNTADYDRYSGFTSGGGTYTVGITGWIELTGGVTLASSNSGSRALQWMLNGSAVAASAASMWNLGGQIYENLSARTTCVHVTTGDQISLQVYQNCGSALPTYSTAPHGSSLQIRYVGQ